MRAQSLMAGCSDRMGLFTKRHSVPGGEDDPPPPRLDRKMSSSLIQEMQNTLPRLSLFEIHVNSNSVKQPHLRPVSETCIT